MYQKHVLESFSDGELGELVSQRKAAEAYKINSKGGRKAQIDYLTGEDSTEFRSNQCRLADIVYEAVFERTESFEENNIGADLAYLLGAIVRNKVIEWERGQLPGLHRILSEAFPIEHPVWGHIAIRND